MMIVITTAKTELEIPGFLDLLKRLGRVVETPARFNTRPPSYSRR